MQKGQMTLSVYPYKRNDNLEIEYLTVPPEYSEIAGLEATRWSFWGSNRVRDIGLLQLPKLTSEDIYAEGDELPQLKKEIETLQRRLADICNEREQEYWQFILSNILAAIQIAEANNGGVYIG